MREASESVERLVDLTDPLRQVLVVGGRDREEANAALPHRLDGGDDVVRDQGNVLDARPAVELQVLLDLTLALALGRLIGRELDLPGAVLHDLRHQR